MMADEKCLSVEDAKQKLAKSRYAIDGYIGSGGMACVYRASERGTPNTYAIKLLRDEYAQRQSVVSMFEIEAQNMRNLQYPNIVRFYRFVQDDNAAYIVMEYVDGVPLSTLMRRLRRINQPFPLNDAMRIVAQVARAIAYVHAESYIHRDIKPGNVLLEKRDGTAYLTDMGIMSALNEVDNFVKAGTPSYMPHEQQKYERIDHTADIYAFAVMVFEMLTGEKPFKTTQRGDAGRADLARQHERAPIPALTAIRTELPVGINTLFDKALTKTPAERYQSAMQFAEDVHGILAPLLDASLQDFASISAKQIDLSSMDTPQPPSRRRNVLVGASVALLTIVAVIGGVLFATSENGAQMLGLAQIATETISPSATIIPTDTPVLTATENTSTEMVRPSATERAATAQAVVVAENTQTDISTETVTTTHVDETGEMSALAEATRIPASETSTAMQSTATHTVTATSTLTASPTHTVTPSATPTITQTPTPIPTAYLNGEPLLYIVEDVDAVDLAGNADNLTDALAFSLANRGMLVPLRIGTKVNGFRVDMTLSDTAPTSLTSYGIAFRVQVDGSHYRFRIEPDSAQWVLEAVNREIVTSLDTGRVFPSDSVSSAMPTSLAVSGLDSFIRIDYEDQRLQFQLSDWQQGSVGLWLAMDTPDATVLQSVQVGLLGDEAVQAVETNPTAVPPPLTPDTQLLSTIQTMRGAGDVNVVLDCAVFVPAYEALTDFIETDDDLSDDARRAQQASAVIYNRCQLEGIETMIDFNDALSDYLTWENALTTLIIELQNE